MNIVIRLAILLLRPFEIWHAASIERGFRKGKFKYHPVQGCACVSTTEK